MRFLILFLITSCSVSAQGLVSESFFEANEVNRKNLVTFTHVPFLLLRVNPSQWLGYNNTFQFGAEVAPPVGKLSFAFDYGTGKGKNNLNKQVRAFQPDNRNKELRGEIRAYFSDWFPFYALDKKPFGRYYALEYVNGTYDRNLGIPAGGAAVNGDNALSWMQSTREKTHVVHVKFGRHIHLHRHLFLDVYGGIGAGKSTFTLADGTPLEKGRLYNPAEMDFWSHKRYESPKTKQYFFSKTLGVRIVVPI
ncbi:hypothetical protein [Leadbetterella sp. DM7]|uniref:hypothetical protein n=1 Tax=Leadbetterella sp. DM7 TaxID=3235085 RepID=UPI00349E739D